MDRITMNTENLQKIFPEIYQQFFESNDIVFSSCNVMPWNPSFGYYNDLVRIKQKVPTKTYIGFNLIENENIEFETIKFFDIVKNEFEDVSFYKINDYADKLEDFLKKYLLNQGFSKGIKFSFISENPRGHGFGFSGVSAALIAFGVYFLIGKIDKNIEYNDFLTSECFQEIYKLSWQIESILRDGKASGSNSYVALSNSSLPVIFFKNKIQDYENFCYNIKDFLKISNSVINIPVDYGIIYTGTDSTYIQNKYIYDMYKNYYIDLQTFIKDKLNDNNIKNISNLGFGAILNEEMFSKFLELGSIFTLKILKGFNDLFLRGFDENVSANFIDIFQSVNQFLSILEKENNIISLFKNEFEHSKKWDDEKIGVYTVNSGKVGGSYVFTMNYNKGRETIEAVIDGLKSSGHNKISLEYASWIDGYCDDGIKVEQFISEEMFSKYVQKGKVFYKDNQGSCYMASTNDILEKEVNGIILDTITNKIYFNGLKLTSKDIRSQNSTIEIISILLENIGSEVRNSTFEVSTYTKNKNEMISKIILPLNKFAENNFGKKLPIICKGSLYDFYMSIGETDIPIGIIKKI